MESNKTYLKATSKAKTTKRTLSTAKSSKSFYPYGQIYNRSLDKYNPAKKKKRISCNMHTKRLEENLLSSPNINRVDQARIESKLNYATTPYEKSIENTFIQVMYNLVNETMQQNEKSSDSDRKLEATKQTTNIGTCNETLSQTSTMASQIQIEIQSSGLQASPSENLSPAKLNDMHIQCNGFQDECKVQCIIEESNKNNHDNLTPMGSIPHIQDNNPNPESEDGTKLSESFSGLQRIDNELEFNLMANKDEEILLDCNEAVEPLVFDNSGLINTSNIIKDNKTGLESPCSEMEFLESNENTDMKYHNLKIKVFERENYDNTIDSDVFEYMKKSENEWIPVLYRICTNQHNISPLMRSMVIDWMAKIITEFSLKRQTLYIAINYIDRYLSNCDNIEKLEYLLIGTAAVILASKMEEGPGCDISIFLKYANNGFSKEQIFNGELKLCQVLSWKLTPVTMYNWVNLCMSLWDEFIDSPIVIQARIINNNENNKLIHFKSSNYLSYKIYREFMQMIDCCTLDLQSLKYKNRAIIASFLYLIIGKYYNQFTLNEIIDKIPVSNYFVYYDTQGLNYIFNQFLQTIFNYKLEDLIPCINYAATFFLLETSDELPYNAIMNLNEHLTQVKFIKILLKQCIYTRHTMKNFLVIKHIHHLIQIIQRIFKKIKMQIIIPIQNIIQQTTYQYAYQFAIAEKYSKKFSFLTKKKQKPNKFQFIQIIMNKSNHKVKSYGMILNQFINLWLIFFKKINPFQLIQKLINTMELNQLLNLLRIHKIHIINKPSILHSNQK